MCMCCNIEIKKHGTMPTELKKIILEVHNIQ